MPSGSRLVASTRRSGQAASSRCTRAAVSAIRCSQLSTTTSSRRSRSAAASRSTGSCRVFGDGNSPVSRSPSAARTACGTSDPSVSGARSTKHASSGAAASIATRVLPMPPGPVRVTSRAVPSSSRTRSSSSARPTKLVSWAGTPVARAGSAPRIARGVSASSGDGSAPSSSASVLRVSSKTVRASAGLPAPCSARMSSPRSRSRSGCRVTSSCSCATSPPTAPPRASSASARSSTAVSISSSSRATSRPGTSTGSRQSSSASPSSAAAAP